MSKPEKKFKNTEETPKAQVSTLRGVRRRAREGHAFEGRVRTRGGYRVSARIRDGQVEVMDPTENNKWTPYPEKGKNLDPSWRPTPPSK
jgi:hypothetical protein